MSQKQICVSCPEGVYPEDLFCAACGEEQYASEKPRGKPENAPNITSDRRIGDDPFDSVSDVSTEPRYEWAKPIQPLTIRLSKGKPPRPKAVSMYNLNTGKPSDLPDLTLEREEDGLWFLMLLQSIVLGSFIIACVYLFDYLV